MASMLRLDDILFFFLVISGATGTIQLLNNNDEIKFKSVNVQTGGGYVCAVHAGGLRPSATGFMEYNSSIWTIERVNNNNFLKLQASRVNRTRDYYLKYQSLSAPSLTFTHSISNAAAFEFVSFPIGTGLNFVPDPVFVRLRHITSGKFMGARANGQVELLPEDDADETNRFVNPSTLFFIHRVAQGSDD